jgi:hypothetical protein
MWEWCKQLQSTNHVLLLLLLLLLVFVRFKASPHGVLVATDVAARGLDVAGVQVGAAAQHSTARHDAA